MILPRTSCDALEYRGDGFFFPSIRMNDPSELPPDLFRRIPLFAELAKVLSWSGGPVNWDLARQVAVAAAAEGETIHDVSASDASEIVEGVRLGELWLTEATGLETPGSLAEVRATTPARWAETACDTFRELIDPVAARVGRAVADQAPPADNLPEEIPASAMQGVIAQMAPLFLGIQAGTVVGMTAAEVLGRHEVLLPGDDEGIVTVLVPSVDSFAASYGLDRAQTRLWSSVSGAAYRLLADGIGGLRTHFFALFHDYVAAVEVDLGGAVERLQSMDMADISRLQETMQSQGLFGLVEGPGTASALERMGRLLALAGSFCDLAVSAAATRLPDAAKIAEAAARRRIGATQLERFLGIELPAETRRRALAFSGEVVERAGWAALARAWSDTDAMPDAEELNDPTAWLNRIGGSRE
jgi:putative hydrolase